jgi:hypothetical protein
MRRKLYIGGWFPSKDVDLPLVRAPSCKDIRSLQKKLRRSCKLRLPGSWGVHAAMDANGLVGELPLCCPYSHRYFPPRSYLRGEPPKNIRNGQHGCIL